MQGNITTIRAAQAYFCQLRDNQGCLIQTIRRFPATI